MDPKKPHPDVSRQKEVFTSSGRWIQRNRIPTFRDKKRSSPPVVDGSEENSEQGHALMQRHIPEERRKNVGTRMVLGCLRDAPCQIWSKSVRRIGGIFIYTGCFRGTTLVTLTTSTFIRGWTVNEILTCRLLAVPQTCLTWPGNLTLRRSALKPKPSHVARVLCKVLGILRKNFMKFVQVRLTLSVLLSHSDVNFMLNTSVKAIGAINFS